MLGFWISLVKVSQGFEYASDSKCKGSEYGKVANIRELRRVLNKPEYFKKYLNMRGYALIKVNMFEYAWKYQNKQNSEHARILNVSDAVYSMRSLYKILSSYRDRDYSEYCQTFKMKCFTQRIMPGSRHTIRNFSGQGSFVS